MSLQSVQVLARFPTMYSCLTYGESGYSQKYYKLKTITLFIDLYTNWNMNDYISTILDSPAETWSDLEECG